MASPAGWSNPGDEADAKADVWMHTILYDLCRMRIRRLILSRLALLCIALAVASQSAWISVAGAQTGSVSGLTSARKTADKTPVAALIDLNRATAAELKSLPGISDAYSAAIIRNRPYANKTQLKTRNVIPPGAYSRIKDKVIAKQ